MKLMPIVYVTDMAKARNFYTALGLQGDNHNQSNMWSEFSLGDATLALHHVDQLPEKQIGRIELALVERLKAANVPFEREISDEAFGRSIQVRDPDGRTTACGIVRCGTLSHFSTANASGGCCNPLHRLLKLYIRLNCSHIKTTNQALLLLNERMPRPTRFTTSDAGGNASKR